jgi:type I restriction enzyme R subunit
MTQLREEVRFTRGRVIVRGKTVKRGEAKKTDYVLYYKPGILIAVVEAKDDNYALAMGMQQPLEYAEASTFHLHTARMAMPSSNTTEPK